jgi:hypothetical protein
VLVFARPLLLWIGAAAALVPLALHFLVRRPPGRAPLPTARFLSPDPRTSVRPRRRPTDLRLLALRMLLALLAGAALAGPAWLPDRDGTAHVVLLDRASPASPASWRAAVDSARRLLLAADGAPRGELVLFDSAATRLAPFALTPARFDSLSAAPPMVGGANLSAALRALPAAARELRAADSVRATLVTAAGGEAWTPGLAALRSAAWPGRIDVLSVAPPTGDTAAAGGAAPRLAVVAGPGDGGRFVSAALGALGWTVQRRDVADGAEGAPSLVVQLSPPTADGRATLRRRAEGGATVILPGRVALGGEAEMRDGGDVAFPGGLRANGAAGRQDVSAAAAARVAAVWDDGQPAVLAERAGRGCVVSAGFALEGGRLPLTASYPRVLERLAAACAPAGGTGRAAATPLDRGAIRVLRGAGPAALPSRAVAGADAGLRLDRWALGLLLAVALAETALAYGRRERA